MKALNPTVYLLLINHHGQVKKVCMKIGKIIKRVFPLCKSYRSDPMFYDDIESHVVTLNGVIKSDT